MTETVHAPGDLRAAFERLQHENAGPAWLQERRVQAVARFLEVGFPSVHEEEWKFTDVSPLANQAFRWEPADGSPPPGVEQSLPTLAGPRLVFVNGQFNATLSRTVALPPGVQVESLARALERGADGLASRLGTLADVRANPFVALNTAFLRDGAYIHVPRGAVVEDPIHLVFASEAAVPAVSHPRILALVDEGAQARMVETHLGPPDQVYFTNAVTEAFVGEGATFEHYKLEREGNRAFHMATIAADAARASNVYSHSTALGGSIVRNDIQVRFRGEGAEATLDGLYVLGDQQLVDHHTVVDHAVPHCTSREFYKGILDGRARGVFYGKVFIRKDAQKSNASQTNKNLLLSEGALADSTPALEINANDVKASHGSTIGQLDAGSLFYLRARGLDPKTARSFLTYAFARDVVRSVRIPELRAHLDDLILGRLPDGETVKEALYEIEA